jgi:hypothetical protein
MHKQINSSNDLLYKIFFYAKIKQTQTSSSMKPNGRDNIEITVSSEKIVFMSRSGGHTIKLSKVFLVDMFFKYQLSVHISCETIK